MIGTAVTGISIGLFYLLFYRLVDVGPFTKPLAFISLLSYPGMLPAFAIAGAMKGSSHGGGDLGVILFIAIPINLLFYFTVIFVVLRLRGLWPSRTRRESPK